MAEGATLGEIVVTGYRASLQQNLDIKRDAPGIVDAISWFRAAGYRTYFKGKWHASHAQLDAEDGEPLLSIDGRGEPIEENIERYLEADLLDDYGFSEWVGPEPHGLGKHNTGTVKDPFTADETIDLDRSSVVDLTSTLTGTNAGGYQGGTTAGNVTWTASTSSSLAARGR